MNNYLRILSVDNPADAKKLARKAKRVTNPQSTEVIVGIQRMKAAATAWEHANNRRCEGLAAPQIGWNARVIIVRVTNETEPKDPRTFTEGEFDAVGAHLMETDKRFAEADWETIQLYLVTNYDKWKFKYGSTFDPWRVMINPTIKQVEGERKAVEGCLSVPNGGYEVTRPTHVAFKYTQPNGKTAGERPFMEVPQGRFLRKVYFNQPNGSFLAKFNDNDVSAQVLSHELDHLQGKCISNHGTLIIGGGTEKL